MKKIGPSNKYKAFLWDYYLTNKEISRKNQAAEEAEEQKRQEREGPGRRPFSGREKVYLAVILAGLVFLVVKYAVL